MNKKPSIKYIEPAEFAKRTISIIKDYSGTYETTNLLNACVGLLFTATSKYRNTLKNISDSFLTDNGITSEMIKVCKQWDYVNECIVDEAISVYSVCRHIRNSIAHCNFKPEKGNHNTIKEILFEDYIGSENTFKLKLKVEDFRSFVSRIAESVTTLNDEQRTIS